MNTVRHVLEHASKCYPSSIALVEGKHRTTYQELADRVARTITVLRDLGVGEGTRVAILAQNSTQFVELWLAVPMMGATLAPLNTRLTRRELTPIIEEYDPLLLLTDTEPAGAQELVPPATRVQAIDAEFAALVMAAEPSTASSTVTEDDVMSVVYTGGTTGRSKGVMLTHRNRLSDALSMVAALRLTSEDVWLNCSPIFHTSGTFCILPTLWTGATLVIEPKFEVDYYADLVQREGVTIGFMVPKMIQDLLGVLESDDPRIATLRFVGHGGAPITESLLRRACEEMPSVEFASIYGATELAPMATVFQHQERCAGGGRFASCGQPVLGVEVRVVDEDGRPVETRVLGEIVVRGPNVMKGYFRRPDVTAEAIVDGFYRTGDLGFLDEEGFVYVADRKKDMIISGGENVYSLEVETAIAEFAGVVEVAVYGRADDNWGEIVCATIVADGELDLQSLERHCRERLAGYKQPRQIQVVREPLPRTPAGKVSKRDLRAASAGAADALP